MYSLGISVRKIAGVFACLYFQQPGMEGSISQKIAMTMRRVRQKHKSIIVGPQAEDIRVGEERCLKERDRRFGVHRATVKRCCKQLDERGTLQSRKAPGNRPKLDFRFTGF
jgi:hypothetical protein